MHYPVGSGWRLSSFPSCQSPAPRRRRRRATRDCTEVDLCDGKPADICLLRQTFSWVHSEYVAFLISDFANYLAKSAAAPLPPFGRRPINRFRKSRFPKGAEDLLGDHTRQSSKRNEKGFRSLQQVFGKYIWIIFIDLPF